MNNSYNYKIKEKQIILLDKDKHYKQKSQIMMIQIKKVKLIYNNNNKLVKVTFQINIINH